MLPVACNVRVRACCARPENLLNTRLASAITLKTTKLAALKAQLKSSAAHREVVEEVNATIVQKRFEVGALLARIQQGFRSCYEDGEGKRVWTRVDAARCERRDAVCLHETVRLQNAQVDVLTRAVARHAALQQMLQDAIDGVDRDLNVLAKAATGSARVVELESVSGPGEPVVLYRDGTVYIGRFDYPK